MQQQDYGQEELTFEPLPQRVGANKNKRRRKGDPQQPPPAAAPADGNAADGDAADPAAAQPAGTAAAAAAAAGIEQQQQQPAGNGVTAAAAGGSGTRAAMPAYRSAAVGLHKFEYLDHTADVQLHAWGASLVEAFEQVGLALFNVMTPIDALTPDEACTRQVVVSGHDLQSLLFNYLDELLFVYATEYIMMCQLSITAMTTGPGDAFSITATGRGEKFDRQRHECGTEVKAITFSAMQIREAEGDCEVFVIVDI